MLKFNYEKIMLDISGLLLINLIVYKNPAYNNIVVKFDNCVIKDNECSCIVYTTQGVGNTFKDACESYFYKLRNKYLLFNNKTISFESVINQYQEVIFDKITLQLKNLKVSEYLSNVILSALESRNELGQYICYRYECEGDNYSFDELVEEIKELDNSIQKYIEIGNDKIQINYLVLTCFNI